jgi:hypothetical protein
MNLHGRFSGKKNKGTENIKQAQIHLHLLGNFIKKNQTFKVI